jgi:hypothetical protein
MNRILTLQVELTDAEKAQWIWDNYSGKDTENGVRVMCVWRGRVCDMRDDEDEED